MDINAIKMIGIDKDAPLKTREKASLKNFERVFHELKKLGFQESVVLSTCHRSEIYFYSSDENFEKVERFYLEYTGLKGEERKYLKKREGCEAVKHIFRVAAGLESMVVGEDQILSQVKEALSKAQEFEGSGKILNRLFREAVTLGKRVRAEMGIGSLSLSISYIAVKFIEENLDGLKDKKAFVIGAGEMGKIAIKHLLDKEAKVFATNRSAARLISLKEEFPTIEVIPYEEKYLHIASSDIVISATDAPHYTVNYEKLMEVHKGRRIYFVDLGVPRDIDPKIGTLKEVSLYTIDDLKKTAEENLKERISLIPVIDKMVEEKVEEFAKWYRELEIEPYIKEVNRYAEKVYLEEFEKVVNKINSLSEKDREKIRLALRKVANKMANKMITQLRIGGIV